MPSSTSSMAKQIGEMGRLAGDVKSLLGSQKDVLSRAGLNFPPQASAQQAVANVGAEE